MLTLLVYSRNTNASGYFNALKFEFNTKISHGQKNLADRVRYTLLIGVL
jgi:hypothetical protein